MSKGSPIIAVRFAADELAKLIQELCRYNSNPINPQVTLSEYIRRAVAEKIDHASRSRKKRARGKDLAPSGLGKHIRHDKETAVDLGDQADDT